MRIERAHYFDVAFCEDPNCGPHITAYRRDDTPICVITASANQTRILIKMFQDHLYEKATRRTDE